MAEKILNGRLQLRYDVWSNWNDTSNQTKGANLVLKRGEMAVCEVPANTGANQSTSEPVILFKVGDGTKKFFQLPWCSGVAADVYSWAKAADKPTYSANEITGLADYISGKIQDSNTQYQIVEIKSGNTVTGYKLQSKEVNGSFADIAGMPIINIMTDAEVNALITTALNAKNFGDIVTHNASEFSTSGHDHNDKYYTEGEMDTKLAAKQDTLSFEGAYNPSNNKVTTKSYVDNKVAEIVGSAPETLDTLNELATALGNDPNFATTVATQIGSKVDKVENKGLSTNDLTNELKANYDAAYMHSQATHAPAGAQANIIESVKVNGTVLSINSKAVDISVPTGALANKNTVSESDLDSALSTKINGKLDSATAGNTYAAKSHTHGFNDITQESDLILVFNGGSATTVI